MPADITSVNSIPRAPHHLALVGLCPVCDRKGQYVIERDEWKEQQVKAYRELAEGYLLV